MSNSAQLVNAINYYRRAFDGVRDACNVFKDADKEIIRILEDIITEIEGIGKSRFKGEVIGTIISDGTVGIVVLALACGAIITMPLAAAVAAGIAVGQGTKIASKYWEKHTINKREIPEIISDMLSARQVLANNLSAEEQNLVKMSKDLGESLDKFQSFVDDSTVFGRNSIGLVNIIFAPAAGGLISMARLGTVTLTGETLAGASIAAGTTNMICCLGACFTFLSFAIMGIDLYFLRKGRDQNKVIDKINIIIRELLWEIDQISAYERKLKDKVNVDLQSTEQALEDRLNELTSITARLERLQVEEERDNEQNTNIARHNGRELLAEFRRLNPFGSMEDYADFISTR